MSSSTALAIRLYRWLAHALPEDFLRQYGPEMIAAGEDTIRSVAVRRGFRGLAFLMFHLVFDLGRRLPAEHFNELTSDLKHAIRTLSSSKGMVLAVALSTGLAIAITLGTYNEMTIVFHAVPGVGDPGNVFTIQAPVSYTGFERFTGPDSPFAAAAAYMGPVAFSIRGGGTTERLWGHIVTPNYFEVLKAGTAAGRTFSSTDQLGSTADVIISEGYWQRRFGGSSGVIGQTLQINGEPATIIGIAAKDFIGASPLTSAAELWISTQSSQRIAPELDPALMRDPLQAEFQLIGRLKPGVTPAQAEAKLNIVAKELAKERGEADSPATQTRLVTVLPGGQLIPIRKEDLPGTLAAPAVLEGLLLLLACTNASTLLLAKAGARRKEITIRAALGASRRRIIKQLLTESITLGLFGGIVGLALALFLNLQSQKAIANTFPSYIRIDFSMHWLAVVLGFSVSIIAGILFGVVPALKATSADLMSGLKAGRDWFLPGYRWFSSRNGLICLQVASSTSVVIFVGILALGFQRSSNTGDVGFEPRDLYTFSIDPFREGYSVERAWDLLKTLPDKLRQHSDVADVSVAENPPMGNASLRALSPRLAAAAPSLPAYVGEGNAKRLLGRITNEYVGIHYFETLVMPPLHGRVFTAQDRPEDSKTIVINAMLAQQAWPSADAIGRQLEIGNQSFEVIGVVKDFRTTGLLANAPPVAFHLLGPAQVSRPALQGMTVIVRGHHGVDIRDRLAPALAGVDPNLTVFNIASQSESLTQALFLTRVQTVSYGVIGLFGLMLAAVGLAGVTAYAVAQRTKEIGIRVALGATRLQVLRIVSKEGIFLVAAGILVGEAGAIGVTKIVNAWYVRLYEVTRSSSSDPVILIAAPFLLAAFTMIFCYIPARRALRIDPVSALRQD